MKYQTGYYVWEIDGGDWYVIFYEGEEMCYYDCYHSRPSGKYNWGRQYDLDTRFKLINNDRLLEKYGDSIQRLIKHGERVG